MRLLYNNCNGLQTNEFFKSRIKEKTRKRKEKYLCNTQETTKISGIFGLMNTLSASVMCLSETQTAWEKALVRETIISELKKNDNHSSLIGSTSRVTSASFVKPGGTMVCTDGNWTSRIYEKGQDAEGMGRWSYIKVAGKKNTKLTIICGYRCCKGQKLSTVGTLTSYFQQYCLLRKKGIKKPNPQVQFIKDLKKFIKKCIDNSEEVLLCLDANETWNASNSRIRVLAKTLGLQDVAGRLTEKAPDTYTKKILVKELTSS